MSALDLLEERRNRKHGRGTLHVDTGRLLEQFRGRWQVAFLQVLVNEGRFGEASVVADRIELPDDDRRALAEAHYLRGLIDESRTRLLGRPLDDRQSSETIRSDAPSIRDVYRPSRPVVNGWLNHAAGWFRRALDASASHTEARLHLGRVELERERQREAIGVLSPLCEAPPGSPAIGGLAWLFTAEAHAGLGALDEAARAYERATAITDVEQSARSGLMQLALRRGNLAEAVELTTGFTSQTPSGAQTDRPDAWAAYLGRRRADSEAVLLPLRETILP